jgi:hypothetical protein
MNSSDCELIVKALLDGDPKFKQLLGSMGAVKEEAEGRWIVKCRPCSRSGTEGQARAFITAHPSEIILCSNRLSGRKNIEEALLHELVHAYDYSLARYDFYSCEGLASSEVRAAREAECSGRMLVFDWLRSRCIRSCASRSTSNIYGKEAHECVKRVFDKAVLDKQPFKETR